jgi:hypothetical protein
MAAGRLGRSGVPGAPCWRAWPSRRARPTVAAAFTAAPPERVAELLETLATLGQARSNADGRFVA